MAAPLAIAAGAAAARAVAKKLAGKAAKKATTTVAAKANARGLKAAQGPSLASKAKKLEAVSGRVERAKVKMKAQDNMILGSSKKEAYSKAAKTADAAKKAADAKSVKATPKVKKKLKQLDRRSKAVAPKKKYSDMTPAEKRKYDSLNAEYTNRMISKPKK